MTNYENIIKENAQKYYENGTQDLSDVAFDALVDEVKKENPNSDILKTGWGYEVNENGKVRHKYGHIGSLDKVHSYEDVLKFYKSMYSVTLDISAKLDGISAVLYYNNGVLEKALTRGDGEYGIDITDKILHILNYSEVNLKASHFTGAVRGEIMMLPEKFNEYKKEYPEAKNHRNSAAGIINKKDDYKDLRYLSFVAYSVVGIVDRYKEEPFTANYDISYLNAWLKENFNNVAPRVMLNNITSSKEFKETLEKYKDIWSKAFYIDGLVLSDNVVTHYPNNEMVYNSCAYKFEDEVAVTKVISIEWNMSKNSEMIPVLNIEPVELEGTTVKRVTAFNAKFVQDNNLGSGAIILVCKRNQIIPYVMEIIESAKLPDLPIVCPYCNSELIWDNNHIHLYCNTTDCEQKNEERIKAWCMNLSPIDNLGWKTIDKCLKTYLPDCYNIISLMQTEERIPTNNETSEKGLVNQLINNLQNNHFTVSQFLLALNIPGLGKISANKFEKAEDSEELFNYIINTDMEYCDKYTRLLDIIQDKNTVKDMATIYHNYIKNCYKLVENRIIFNKEKEIEDKGEVVITGSLTNITRSEFEKILIANGWTLSNTVKKDTRYLITNTPEATTSKNKKADELGITKITENDFIKNVMR